MKVFMYSKIIAMMMCLGMALGPVAGSESSPVYASVEYENYISLAPEVDFLHRFRKLDMKQEKHRQALIDTFVNAVFVHDDKILIGYNFQDGTRTITLTDVQTATDESGSDLEMFGVPKNADTFYRYLHFLFALDGTRTI